MEYVSILQHTIVLIIHFMSSAPLLITQQYYQWLVSVNYHITNLLLVSHQNYVCFSCQAIFIRPNFNTTHKARLRNGKYGQKQQKNKNLHGSNIVLCGQTLPLCSSFNAVINVYYYCSVMQRRLYMVYVEYVVFPVVCCCSCPCFIGFLQNNGLQSKFSYM